MTYSEPNTISHPLAARYQKLVNVILITEGARTTPFTAEIGIDLDQCEIENNIDGNRDNTMDFCIDLASREMLLVEAKLRVKDPRNLKKSELENKIRHSKALLIESRSIVAREKVFLFDKSVVVRARYQLSQLFSNNPNVLVYTVQDFKNNCF